jgi:hypothetical protein
MKAGRQVGALSRAWFDTVEQPLIEQYPPWYLEE